MEKSVQLYLGVACQCKPVISNWSLISKLFLLPGGDFFFFFLILNYKNKTCSSKPCLCVQVGTSHIYKRWRNGYLEREGRWWKARCRVVRVVYIWFSMSLDNVTLISQMLFPFSLLIRKQSLQNEWQWSGTVGFVFQAAMTFTAFSSSPSHKWQEKTLNSIWPTSSGVRPLNSKDIWLLLKSFQHLLWTECL